jgi:hypothetical protein
MGLGLKLTVDLGGFLQLAKIHTVRYGGDGLKTTAHRALLTPLRT